MVYKGKFDNNMDDFFGVPLNLGHLKNEKKS
jgi:hypothetical protein